MIEQQLINNKNTIVDFALKLVLRLYIVKREKTALDKGGSVKFYRACVKKFFINLKATDHLEDL
jgi:predicted transcriptional regulator